jgi:hypothetical protein
VRLQVQLHDAACNSDDLKGVRDLGATVQYTYRSVSGAPLLDFVFTPAVCATNAMALAAAAEVNETAPKDLDQFTRLDGATAAGSAIRYLYTFPTYDAQQTDASAISELKSAMTKRLTNQVCTPGDFVWLREFQGTAEFVYRDKSGAPVFEVAVPSTRVGDLRIAFQNHHWVCR